jgi:hypothetical protein
VPVTVLALPADTAAEVLGELAAAGAPLDGPAHAAAGRRAGRRRAGRGCRRPGRRRRAAVVLAVHVPDGHRLAWGECREGDGGTGLHTYPDLEVVDVVDVETAEQPAAAGRHELVLTQLGLRGTRCCAGAPATSSTASPTTTCPACGRTVPRVLGARRGALVPVAAAAGARRRRRPAGGGRCGARAAGGRRLADRARPPPALVGDRLLLHVTLAKGADPSQAAVDLAQAVRATAGVLPSQVVVHEPGSLPGARDGGRLLLHG